MREEEVEAWAEADRELDEKEVKRVKEEECSKIINLFERVFFDFQAGIDSAARNCRNNDACTALYEVSSAIDAMDMPYVIRQALDVPHPTALMMNR